MQPGRQATTAAMRRRRPPVIATDTPCRDSHLLGQLIDAQSSRSGVIWQCLTQYSAFTTDETSAARPSRRCFHAICLAGLPQRLDPYHRGAARHEHCQASLSNSQGGDHVRAAALNRQSVYGHCRPDSKMIIITSACLASGLKITIMISRVGVFLRVHHPRSQHVHQLDKRQPPGDGPGNT